MSIDWGLLTQVRDRHKQRALEQLLRERRQAGLQQALLQEAKQQLQAEVQAKQQLWQQQVAGRAGGLCAADLRGASAWSRALDTRIAQAREGVQAADQAARQQQARVEARRRELSAAWGGLRKAERMGEQAQAEQRRERELRSDDQADETAAQRWATRRAG